MGRFIQKLLVISVMVSLFQGVPLPFLGPISSASAAVPNIINYQSRLRSPSLAPITALTEIQFTLYNDISAGTPAGAASSLGPVLWKEVHDGISCPKLQPDADGYFSVQLGACTPFPSYITWNNPLYLGVKIEADAEASPRVLLGAHQYALNSQAVNGFTASTTAQANSLLALDASQNFNIATGTFLGTGLNISSTSTLQNVTFTVATGSSLELTNYLSIGAIRLDQAGTSNLTSGAYLVGVFDEFTNSNATTVQAALRDLDIALTSVSTTANASSTLQRAYDGGGIGLGKTINLATSTPVEIVTTVPGLFSSQAGLTIHRAGSPNQGLTFGTTNFGSNFSNFGMTDDLSNITGASGVFAYYNHNNNAFGFSLLGQSGAAKSVLSLVNPDTGNRAAFEFENQSTINSTGILRLRNIPDSANVTLHTGQGSPENVVTADVGSTFFRRDGTASGTQIYAKTQDGNNQGWVGLATVDMINAANATLQSAYDGGGSALGRIVNTVPGQGIILSSATDTSQPIGFNPILSIVGDATPGFSTTTGISFGNLDVGAGQVPAMMFGTAVNQVGATTFGYQLFNAFGTSYEIGLANGLETFGLLSFNETETALDAVTGTLKLRSSLNTDINVSTGQVNITATGQTDQLGAFQFNYNSSTAQGIRLLNSSDNSNGSISIGSLSPEGLLVADSGSVYMRNSTTTSGTQLYVKTTDGINTGWVGVATVDMLTNTSSTTSTLQSAYDGGGSALGRTINTVAAEPVHLVGTTNTTGFLSWNPMFQVTGDGIIPNSATSSGSAAGLVSALGYISPARILSSDVSSLTAATSVLEFFNTDPAAPFYQLALVDGPNGFNTLGLFEMSPTLVSLTAGTGAALTLNSEQNAVINSTNGQIIFQALGAQTSNAFEFFYNSSTGNGIHLLNNGTGGSINTGSYLPEGTVLADKGALFMRVDGTTSGTYLYVKSSNATSTGWLGVATVDMLGNVGGANNGLSVSGTEVILGGTLYQDTVIDGNGGAYNLIVQDVKSFDIAGGGVGSVGSISNTGLIFTGTDSFQLRTPGYLSASTGSVLTLVNPATGEVEYATTTEVDTLQSVVARGATSTNGIYIQATSTFRDILPEAHNTYTLGSTSTRWASLYAGVVNVGTSTWSLAQSTNGNLGIFDQGGAAGNERLSISATSGNVGIGSSTGTSKLFVNVGNVDGLMVRTTNSGYIGVGVSASTEWRLANNFFAANRFDLLYNGASMMAFNTSGNAAIGTAPTTNRLSVNGGLAVGGTGFSDTAAPINGLIVGGSMGVGTSTPASKLHVLSGLSQLNPILTLENPVGNFQIFNASSSPESLIPGSLGDLAIDSLNGHLYIKESGTSTNTGWVRIATGTGSGIEADTLQTVTNRGNQTTTTIQFAGGTSTGLFTLTKSLVEGGGLLEPQVLIKDTTSTGGIVLGRYSTGVDENYSSLAFTSDTSLHPSNTTSVSFDYSHVNNNLLMRAYGNGIFKNGISLGDIINFETALDQGVGPASAFNFTNYGTLKGIMSFSNPSTNIDFLMSTGSPVGAVNANSGSLYFQTDAVATATGHLYLKKTDGSSAGWKAVATMDDVTSTAFVQNGNSFGTTTQLGTNDAQSLSIITSGTTRGTFDTDGGLSLNNTASDRFFLTTTNTVDDNNYLLADGTTVDYLLGFQTGRFLFKNVTTNQDMLSFSHLTNTLTLGTASTGITQSVITMPNASTNLSIGANSSRKFYVRDDSAGVVRFFVRNSNVLATETTNYESLVTTNNDIPNRKFVTEYVTSTAFIQNGNSFGTTTSLGTNDANALRFVTSGTEAMRILNTGFVGIGSSTPSTLLAVAGTSTLQDVNPAGPYTGNMSAYNLGTSTTRWNSLWAGTVNVGTSTWSLSQNAANNFAIFNGPNKTGNEVITVDAATENIGFGTMSQGITPQARLHVLGGDVLMGGNASEEIFKLDPVANTVSLGDYSGWNANTYLQVDDNARKVIIPNGNVGIGITQPRSQFDVAGLIGQNALDAVDQNAGTIFVTTQGAYAYVLNQEANELSVVNISRPNRLEQAGTVNISKRPSDMVVQGQYAYVTAHDTDVLYTIDISDAMNPTQIGSIGLTGGSPTGLSIQGKYAYVVEEGGDRMEIIDISDPSAMNSVTTVGICREPVRVKANGRYVYAICADNSLAVVDVQDPQSPNLITTVGTGRNPKGMDIRGRYLFVTAFDDRQLDVFDLIRPTEPRLITNFDICSGPMGINTQANRAYISCNLDNKLQVIDVSNPARPEIVGTDNTEKAPAYLAIQGRYAYIPATDARVLQSFDLGGGYLQQLQVAGIEGDDLSILQTANMGEVVVQRGLSVGGSAKVDGEFTVSGGIPGRSTAFTINQDGQVGIGTLSPDQLLSVNGDASKIGGGTWSTFSDERLKKDISPYEDGLALITKINPVHFSYNGLGGIATGTKSYIGVLAQDIQQVAPYMVATTSVMLHKSDASPTEVLTFDPNAITYALINSVKELNAKLGATSDKSSISVTTTVQEIHLSGPVLFGQDSVGQAKILSGSKMVQVNFTQPYSVQPIVTISPMDFVDAMYRVADVTTSGFTIQLNQSQSGDRLFSWHAFGGEGAKVYVSDGTSSTLQIIEAPTSSSVPVLAPSPAPSEIILPEPVIEQTSSTSSTPSESTVMSENTSSTESVTP